MNKTGVMIAVGLVVFMAVLAVVGFEKFNGEKKVDIQTPVIAVSTPLDTTYIISGQTYLLSGGKVEKEIAPDSSSKEKVAIWGTPVVGDLDADGDMDAVSFLTQELGGSGTLYFVAIAVNENGIYKGTNAMLLGDRIAPQTIEIRDGRAVVNYAVRNANEAFTTPPSVGKSIVIHFDPKANEIGELAKDFEGEADPSRMSLDAQSWKWVRTLTSNGTIIAPIAKDAFTLSFKKDGSFAMTTDCNSVGGKYVVGKNSINFKDMFATKMFCENSQESVFSAQLADVSAYQFTSKGELILELKNDSGTILLRGM